MRVAAVQHDIVWEDPSATFDEIAPLIADAADAGAELIAVTEMFSTGFSMASSNIAEDLDGPSASFLVEQAQQHQVWMVGSIPTRHPDFELPINQLVVAGDDGIIGRYAKIHPFSFAGEHKHYSPGTEFLTLDLDGVRCTFFICYDLRFADEFWATAADTDLYVVVANWPAVRRAHWQTLLRARAIENQAYVLAANRVGTDGNGLEHAGDSALIDPLGNTLTGAAMQPTIVVGDVHTSTVNDVRTRFPFANDRR